MLLKFRGGMNSLPVTILLGLLIAAFAIFGIGPGILSGPSNVIATVGDTEVSFETYVNNVIREAQQTQAQFGVDVSQEELIRLLNIDQRVLQQMIIDASIEEHTRELGLRATDEQIVKAIREIDAFKLAGALNIASIQAALSSNNLGIDDLETLVGKGVAREQLISAMVDVQPLSKSLASELFTWQDERRQATIVSIKASDITEIPEPSEEDLLATYEASKEIYMTNELRTYNYIIVKPELFLDQATVTEDMLLDEFERSEDEYIQRERRAIKQVNFTSQTAAQEFIDLVKSGTPFVEAAVKLTDFSSNELDIGTLSYTELAAQFNGEIADTVFALDLNGVSAPVERLGGWNVFSATEIIAGSGQSFEDVRDRVEAAVRREAAIDLMYGFLPDLEDAVKDARTLEEAVADPAIADTINLIVASVSGADRQGRNRTGDQVVTQSDEFRVLTEIYQSEDGVGRISDPYDLDLSNPDAGAFFTELLSITEPEQKEYSEVAAQVRTAWETTQRQNKAGELAESVQQRLIAGEDAEAVAAEIGATSLAANNVGRTADANSASSLAPNIRSLIFELGLNQPEIERSSDGDGYVVVRTDGIRPGEPARRPEQVETLYTNLKQQFETELLQQYQTYLSKRYEPEVRDQLRQLRFRSEDAAR